MEPPYFSIKTIYKNLSHGSDYRDQVPEQDYNSLYPEEDRETISGREEIREVRPNDGLRVFISKDEPLEALLRDEKVDSSGDNNDKNSKKDNKNLPEIKEELHFLKNVTNLERVIYEVHLEHLFELITSNNPESSYLKINYVSALSLLANYYKQKPQSFDKYLIGQVLKIDPGFVFSSIKSKDFMNFLKENPETYNIGSLKYGTNCHLFFKKEELDIRGHENKSFFVMFDVLENEEEKNIDQLDQISISLDNVNVKK